MFRRNDVNSVIIKTTPITMEDVSRVKLVTMSVQCKQKRQIGSLMMLKASAQGSQWYSMVKIAVLAVVWGHIWWRKHSASNMKTPVAQRLCLKNPRRTNMMVNVAVTQGYRYWQWHSTSMTETLVVWNQGDRKVRFNH